jgi:hypothetical protein
MIADGTDCSGRGHGDEGVDFLAHITIVTQSLHQDQSHQLLGGIDKAIGFE